MKIEVKDEVELGHCKYIGGSTKISVIYNVKESSIDENEILEVIDNLDHSMILYDENTYKFYSRYYVINELAETNFYEDAASIIFKKLKIMGYDVYDIEVSVELGKIKYSFNYKDVDIDNVWEMF